MLPAVKLDDQPCLGTAKIEDVFVDRHLSFELQAVQTAIAHEEPKNALGVGLIAAQLPGKGDFVRHGALLVATCAPLTPSPRPSPLRGEGAHGRNPSKWHTA